MRKSILCIFFVVFGSFDAVGIHYKFIAKQQPTVLPSLPGAAPFEGHSIWFTLQSYYQMQLLDPDGAVKYSSDIHLDKHGFRTTLQSLTAAKKKHLIFSGCSFTFGDLVNDHETVASQIAPLLPDNYVVNLGRSGSSVFEALFLWLRYDVASLQLPPEGLHVYTLIDAQFERIVHSWRVLDWMRDERPVYWLEGNELRGPISLSGTFKFRLMGWIKRLGIEMWWLRFMHWFTEIELQGATEEMAVYLLELKKAYLRQYPKGRFVVTYFPNTQASNTDLITHLKRLGIEYWEPAKQKGDHEMYRIPNDGHPSPLAYKEQAEFLAKKIKELR